MLDTKDEFTSLKERLRKTEESLEALKSSVKEHFEALHKQCDQLGLKITALEKLITRLSEKIDNSGGGLGGNKTSLLTSKLTDNTEDNESRLNRLEKTLEALQQRCTKTWNDH